MGRVLYLEAVFVCLISVIEQELQIGVCVCRLDESSSDSDSDAC